MVVADKFPYPSRSVPNGIVWAQCVCFSVLYAIWALPETILIRHICLIAGALLSIWVLFQYRRAFLRKNAIPTWLIAALFVWATFHLFFLSGDFALQYAEYTSIWKRTALGAIFALGFGVVLVNNRLNEKNQILLWALMFTGLLAPTLIYIIKFILTYKVTQWGFKASDYRLLYSFSAPFYLPKTAYVCFCLPALGIALGQLVRNIYQGRLCKLANIVYLVTVPAVLFVFYAENIKNGMIYSAILLTLFAGVLLFNRFRENWVSKTVILSIVILIGALFINHNIQSNPSWYTFLADAKIARDTQTYQQWKYNGAQGYPNNEFGSTVSITNYERIAWGKTGLQLIWQHPLGYGLVERSFGHLAKIYWPDSKLHQSHSGWIDLTLGLGIPGILLISTALVILLYQLIKRLNSLENGVNIATYQMVVWTALFSLGLIWFTTEISQKVYFDNLILWLSLAAGITLMSYSVTKPQN
jgi:hypothetical protein